MTQVDSKKLLAWRRNQLLLGGKKEELDWLLDFGAGIDWSTLQSLYLYENQSIDLLKSLDELSALWRKYLDCKMPLQYLIGSSSWRDFILEVEPSVMIPRQETELLIDF